MCIRDRAGTVERLKKMELLEKDIRRQIALKPQLETIEMRADTLRKVIIAWPKTAGRVGDCLLYTSRCV